MTNEPQNKLDQLKKLLDLGVIDQEVYDRAAAAMSAQLAGSGAASSGAIAPGPEMCWT